MKIFKDEELTILFDGKTIIWQGKGLYQYPSGKIDIFFDEVIPEIQAEGITIHFEELTYLCSSAIHSIIKLFKKLNTAGINTRVYYNKNSEWQRIAFKALGKLTLILKNIQFVEE